MAIGDSYATLGGDSVEVHLTVLLPIFCEDPSETEIAVSHFGLASFMGTRHLRMATGVDVSAALCFLFNPVTVRQAYAKWTKYHTWIIPARSHRRGRRH